MGSTKTQSLKEEPVPSITEGFKTTTVKGEKSLYLIRVEVDRSGFGSDWRCNGYFFLIFYM